MINKEDLKSAIKGRVEFDEPLANYSTMRVGGVADAIAWPEGLEDLQALINYLNGKKIPYIVVGGGSNILFLDGGFRGVVILIRGNFAEITFSGQSENGASVIAQAGVSLGKLVQWCSENGLGGLEFLATIPGTVGGAVSMNAGWKDKEIGSFIESITFIDGNGKIIERNRRDLEFSYRKLSIPRRQVIADATFNLKRQEAQVAHQIIEEQRQYRRSTQPLHYPNLGSIFKNPIAPKGKKRIPAGKLVEESGLKGVRVRGAKVAEEHANFIVNVGDARASDIIALINLIKDKVKKDSGITLETEIAIYGEDL